LTRWLGGVTMVDMGIARAGAAVGATWASVLLVAGASCVVKSSGGGGTTPTFDASFDASFGEDSSIEDAGVVDSARPVEASLHDTGTTLDSATPTLDTGVVQDAAEEASEDAGEDAETAEGSCGVTMCATAVDPDSGLAYDNTCSTLCNNFGVSCTCASDTPNDSCYCAVGNAAPGCLTGSLAQCGDPVACAADLSSDNGNCGRCGHACPAGFQCTNGQCPPDTLSFGGSPQPFPDDWVSDGTFIYLASCGEQTVNKIPVLGTLDGGAGTVLSAAQTCPSGIAIDGTNAYWTDASTGAVWSAPLSGAGTPTQLGTTGQAWFDAPIALHGIAMDATNLYWAVQPMEGFGFVYAMPKTGGTPRVLAGDAYVSRASIYVDATNVYWMARDTNDDGQVRSVSKTTIADGGAPSTPLATFVGDQPIDFVVLGSTIYVGAGISNTIWTFPTTGGTVAAFYQTAVYGSPWNLTTDGTSMYWTDWIGSNVYVKPLAGGYAQRIAQNLTEPDLILLDSNNVYFTSNYGGYWSLPASYRP
jgi:hypothetical protein